MKEEGSDEEGNSKKVKKEETKEDDGPVKTECCDEVKPETTNTFLNGFRICDFFVKIVLKKVKVNSLFRKYVYNEMI